MLTSHEKFFEGIEVALARRQVSSGQSPEIHSLHVGSSNDQLAHDLCETPLRGVMQSCKVNFLL
jgi:hypothetical protein